MGKNQEEHKADSTMKLISNIWYLIKGRRTRFFIATFFELISNIAWLYPAYALSLIVNFLANYSPGQPVAELKWIALIWIAASIIHYGGKELAYYLGFQISERTALDAQLRTIKHLLLLDLAWHEKESSGKKLKRVQKGGEGIDEVIRIWFNHFIRIIVNFFGMVFIIAAFDRRIAAVMLVFIVTHFTISHFFTKRAGKAAHIVNIGEEDLQGVAFETVNNIRSVKVLGMHHGLLGIIKRKIDNLFEKIRIRIGWFRSRGTVLNLWAQIFRLSLTFFIAWGIVKGRYEIGFLVLFITYFNYVWESIDRLSNAVLDFVVAKYGVSRMMDILKEPVTIDHDEGKYEFPRAWRKISIESLTFAYGKRTVLKNVSFDIKRGEKIGIVGISGAGKSTLFKLLLKEHENYEGEILFDGIPLRNIKRTSYFNHSAVVLQDTEVFNFKLRDNVSLSNVDESENEELLRQAVEIAHVTDFMEKLPNGLDTYIGEKGVKLSGGEKQRVGIARAIFKEPDILFLDEATSHLDMESEEKIKDSLHNFFRQVTAIVIAHRLSTIREMDRIIVIEKGWIVESGSFDDLVKKRGRFYELWEKQKF